MNESRHSQIIPNASLSDLPSRHTVLAFHALSSADMLFFPLKTDFNIRIIEQCAELSVYLSFVYVLPGKFEIGAGIY